MINLFASLIFAGCSTASVISTKPVVSQTHIEHIDVKSKREIVYETALDNITLIAPHIKLKTYTEPRIGYFKSGKKTRKKKVYDTHQVYVASDASNNANMFDRGSEDARIYKQFTNSCEALFEEIIAEYKEADACGLVKRPIATYLACSDGWVSSCGCGGGRGCCSWHGGIGQCVTEYKEEHEYSQECYDKHKAFNSRGPDFIVCNKFIPPWPKYDIQLQDNGSIKIVFQHYSLSNFPEIEDNPLDRAGLQSSSMKAKIPKNAKLGVDAEYIRGWKSFDYNKSETLQLE